MKENPSDRLSFQDFAESMIGDSVNYFFNNDSSMVLCTNTHEAAALPNPQSVHYLVIDLQDNSALHRAHLANGSVSWYSSNELLIKNRANYPSLIEQGSYIYNIEKKQRRKFTNHYPTQKE